MTRRTDMRELADRVYEALVDSVPSRDYDRMWSCLHQCSIMMEIMIQQLEDPPPKAWRMGTAKDGRVILGIVQGLLRDKFVRSMPDGNLEE